jgi:hypothetical protein
MGPIIRAQTFQGYYDSKSVQIAVWIPEAEVPSRESGQFQFTIVLWMNLSH